MAYLDIKDVKIKGISACAPENKECNRNIKLLSVAGIFFSIDNIVVSDFIEL
jgi:hypothetical protein